jgi:hypothetical protein
MALAFLAVAWDMGTKGFDALGKRATCNLETSYVLESSRQCSGSRPDCVNTVLSVDMNRDHIEPSGNIVTSLFVNKS